MYHPTPRLDTTKHDFEVKETAIAKICSLSGEDQKLHLSPLDVSPQSFYSPTIPDTPESPGIPLISKTLRDKPSTLHSFTETGDATETEDFDALSKRDAVS